MKDPWNFYERSLKLRWDILETLLKLPLKLTSKAWITCETLLKHLWNLHVAPMKFSSNTLIFFETPSNYPYTSIIPWHTPLEVASSTFKNTPETPSKVSWKTLKMLSTHPLNFHIKNFLQHPWNFLKTPWKLHVNSSKTYLNNHQNFFETPLKLPQNTLETPSKHPWNFLETTLKLPIHETCMKHPWYFIKTPIRLPWNTFVTP